MIGRLRGILIEKRPPFLLVEVNGLGYELEAPMSTFYRLPEPGVEVILYTHLSVREDAQLLFGFHSMGERRLFRDLLKVNGIGGKLALTILSGVEPAEFVACVTAGDTERLTRLPGVGKKTASRIIVEMRDRLNDFTPEMASDHPRRGLNGPKEEAIAGLVALGFKPQEASRSVQAVPVEAATTEEIIRLALKQNVKN